MNINNVYLYGSIDEEIYMLLPPGSIKAINGQACILQRSIYGLKQAGKQRNKEFMIKITQFGFR